MTDNAAEATATKGRRRTRRATPFVVVAATALLVVLGACGGSSGSASDDGVATAGGTKTGDNDGKDGGDKKADAQEAMLAFARCMREHGVDMPDPQPGDGGFIRVAPGEGPKEVAAPINEEADKACRHHLKDVVPDGAGPADPKEQDRALKFAQCMREHGIDMPDPDFSQEGAISLQIGEGMDPTSPEWKAAEEACREFFGPAGGAAPGGAVSRAGGDGE